MIRGAELFAAPGKLHICWLASPPLDKETSMAIVAVFEGPGFDQANYEKTVRALTNGAARMKSASDWPVPGLLAHIAGQGPNGFRVVDVWESEEAFRKFGETLVPLLKSVGVEGAPQVYPAHTFVKG
jgi:hypothetical protein